MKFHLVAIVLLAVAVGGCIAGCSTMCKIPGVGSLPGVTCPKDSAPSK